MTVYYFGETPFCLFWESVVPQHLCAKLIFFMSFSLLYLKQSYFCYLSLYIYISRDIFISLYFLQLSPHIPSLSRGNPDFCQEKGRCLGVPEQSVNVWDVERSLSRDLWHQEEVFGVCGCVSTTIWSLIVSNLEETNLTSRLRDQVPSRGRNQVIDGSQD
jgi:hypothetical protein